MNTSNQDRIDRLEDKIEIIKEEERQTYIDMLLEESDFINDDQEKIARAFNDYFELDEDTDQIIDYIAEKKGSLLKFDDTPVFSTTKPTEVYVGGCEWIELTIKYMCNALKLTKDQLSDLEEDLDIGLDSNGSVYIADKYTIYIDVSEIDLNDYCHFHTLYTTIDDARIAVENSGVYEMLPREMQADFINELFRGIHRKPESLYNQWVKTGKLED